MHRRSGPSWHSAAEQEPLIENMPTEQQKEPWDVALNTPRKVVSGSMADSKFFDVAESAMKFIAFVLTFVIVLGSAAVSKGTLLFMTSQIAPGDVKSYCNTDLGRYKQFEVTLPDVERTAWIWVIFFAYCVPQLGIFIRSLRICVFKKWESPGFWEYISLFVTESLPAIGSALLVFCVLPQLDVVKGAMLTNAVCFVPGIIGFLSWKPGCSWTSMKVVLDVIATMAQATSFVVWPLIENKEGLWMIPISVIFISFGWWENYVCEDSSVKFIKELAKTKKNFSNGKYFIYIFVSLWKCLVFFVTMMLVFMVQEDNVKLFDDFTKAFSSHGIFITEVAPIVASAGTKDISDVIATEAGTTVPASYLTPVWVFLINIAATYVCYVTGKFACKVMIQGFSFAFPINLTMPVTLSGLIAMSGVYVKDSCAFSDTIPPYLFFDVPLMYYLRNFIAHEHSWIWLIWLLSQAWITAHIWSPTAERLANTEKLFVRPMYDPFLIDQDIAMNRRRNDHVDAETTDDAAENENNTHKTKDDTTRIYVCGTMWHETKEEMEEFLKSVIRLDDDQCARRLARNEMKCDVRDYYELETHIFFDDAFYRTRKHPEPRINSYVKDLIKTVKKAVHNVHETESIIIMPPTKLSTPYGGQLVWLLPGRTKLIAHLKDKAKIRPKKRWSQVMYMYYLLGHRLLRQKKLSDERMQVRMENTYILALDGDIDFQPKAVLLLVDLMKKNKSLGAACGRIHPVGSGPMVWYQKFEYAIGHWLQKSTEHMIGCVLCSPGCFSLFRGKALSDDAVMAKYTTRSTEARHHVQYDQGEDRWLCTLLLQCGYRVEYSAASDAYTHCPEGFNEFYNQRRRWIPSTTANILDLLMDYKYVVKQNDNISRLYIMYQMIMMVGTVLGPGSIFLMLVGAFVAAFQMDQYSSFLWNASPVFIFIVACKIFQDEKVQLFFAATISAIYGLIMMAVLVGIMLQINSDGWLAPSSLFFFCVAGEMILTAMLHPKEFGCLIHGLVYYVTVPSMYMLLIIYTVFNMNNVSWGTREVVIIDDEDKDETTKAATNEPEKQATMKNKVMNFFGKSGESGSFDLSIGNLFRCLLCTSETNPVERYQLEEIKISLSEITTRLDKISRGVQEPEVLPDQPRRTILIEGARARTVQTDEELISEASDIPSTSFDTDWMDDEMLLKSETDNIDMHEDYFWRKVITKYLHPIDDAKDYPNLKQELIDLRDKAVAAFFMINALFVLVVFLLTLKKDLLHINWPFDVKANFTYKEDIGQIYLTRQYLELEPIGMVFLIFFAILLVVQFIAMLLHRFGTFCQILANTNLNWTLCRDKAEPLTEDAKLRDNAVEIVKKLQRLKEDDADDDKEKEQVGRRKTVAKMMQANNTNRPVVQFLDDAFVRRKDEYASNPDKYKGPIRRETMSAVHRRVTVVQHRKSMAAPAPPPGFQPNGGHENFAFSLDSE